MTRPSGPARLLPPGVLTLVALGALLIVASADPPVWLLLLVAVLAAGTAAVDVARLTRR